MSREWLVTRLLERVITYFNKAYNLTEHETFFLK